MSGFTDWLKTSNHDRRKKSFNDTFGEEAIGNLAENGPNSRDASNLSLEMSEQSILPGLLSFFGVVNILLGILSIVMSFGNSPIAFTWVLGVFSIISGILLVATANVVQTILATKSDTRKILQILQDRKIT